MDGVLVIDKPSGPTSFDVVRRIRSLLKEKKVGHTGTLDPMATGVLPVCLGEATKVAGYVTQGDKAYQAVIALGAETDTQDAQGKTTGTAPVPALSREGVEGALDGFRGTFLQTPPMYSAIKKDGKKLYELARAGEEVERVPREVTVYALTLEALSASEVSVSLRCSKGFYVRTLAQELGRALGTVAHLKALRRTACGPFVLAQAIALDAVEALFRSGALPARLISLGDALTPMPKLDVSAEDAERVLHGVPLAASTEGTVRVLGPGGRLLAVANAEHGRLKYLRVMGAGA